MKPCWTRTSDPRLKRRISRTRSSADTFSFIRSSDQESVSWFFSGFCTKCLDGLHAIYDGTTYQVFTGVIVRIVPNASHFEMHMIPLNEQRDALVRGSKWRACGLGGSDGKCRAGTPRWYYARKLSTGDGLQHGNPSIAKWQTRGRQRRRGSVPMSERRRARAGQALRLGRRQHGLRGRRDARGRSATPLER